MRSIYLPQPNQQYKTDHSIVFSCQYQVIGCPRYSKGVLGPPIDQRLKELIQEKQATYGYEVSAMEIMPGHARSCPIMPDHGHLILDVDSRVGVNKGVGQLKEWTANAIREEFPFMKSRRPSTVSRK